MFHSNAPKEWSRNERRTGRLIAFGHGTTDDGDVEVQTKFPVPSLLHDADCAPWFRPPQLVAAERRSLGSASGAAMPYSAAAMLGSRSSLSFDGWFEGKVAWCRRKGRGCSASLGNGGRILPMSDRFRREKYGPGNVARAVQFPGRTGRPRDLAQIERNAITGFRGAFDGNLRFHLFWVDAQNTRNGPRLADQLGRSYRFLGIAVRGVDMR